MTANGEPTIKIGAALTRQQLDELRNTHAVAQSELAKLGAERANSENRLAELTSSLDAARAEAVTSAHWAKIGCPAGTCSFATSTLISDAPREPVFAP